MNAFRCVHCDRVFYTKRAPISGYCWGPACRQAMLVEQRKLQDFADLVESTAEFRSLVERFRHARTLIIPEPPPLPPPPARKAVEKWEIPSPTLPPKRVVERGVVVGPPMRVAAEVGEYVQSLRKERRE